MTLKNRLKSAYKEFRTPKEKFIAPRNAGFLEPKTQRAIDCIVDAIPPNLKTWWGFMGLDTAFNEQEAMTQYSKNVWLYASITLTSQEIARIGFFIKHQNEDGSFDKIFRHQALSTLKFPMGVANTKANLTGNQLTVTTVQHLLLNGNAYWVKANPLPIDLGGSPMGLFPLIPTATTPIPGEDGQIEKYRYRTPTKEFTFDAECVVHFKLPDPEDWFKGQSAIESANTAIKTYKAAENLSFHKIDNRAIPAGVLESQKAIPAKERQKIIDEFLAMHEGAENTGKTGMLPYGLAFKVIQETQRDLQAVEGQEQRRDEILGNMRTGKGLFGLTEQQSRANADAQNFVFQRFNILPFIEMYADTLNTQYLPDFAGIEPGRDVIGFEDPVPENMEDKRKNIDLMMKNGAMTPDEVRVEFGKEPLEIEGATDVPYLPMNMMPLDGSSLDEEDDES